MYNLYVAFQKSFVFIYTSGVFSYAHTFGERSDNILTKAI